MVYLCSPASATPAGPQLSQGAQMWVAFTEQVEQLGARKHLGGLGLPSGSSWPRATLALACCPYLDLVHAKATS